METKPLRSYSPTWIGSEDNELFVYFHGPNCRERNEKFNLKYKQLDWRVNPAPAKGGPKKGEK